MIVLKQMIALRRRIALRHPFRWLVATALLGLAVQPVLLPHPTWVQSVVGGAAAAEGYAMAALVPYRRRPPGSVPRPGPAVTAALAAAMIFVATLIAHAGQVAAARQTQVPPPSFLADVVAVAGAVLFGSLVIGLGVGLKAALGALWRLFRRAPRPSAVLILVPALVLTGSTTAAADGRPSSEPALSRVSSSIGADGESFLRRRPDAATISAVTGRPARTPVRVYVGRYAAPTPARRAELAVAELERSGGFARSAVLINIPTGSGWVNPAAGTALEYLYGGDVATVVMQYAASPSWLAYLRGGEGVQASARALTDAVRARLDLIAAGQRPRLLVYGESLGAWGGLRAYDDARGAGAGIARQVDGALWAGIPGGLPGRTPDRTRVLMHDDDPVPAWSPTLMVHGSSTWPARWLPVVSFWQATGDVIAAPLVPPGFGHRYGPELVDAWIPLIETAGVPQAAPPDRLDAVRRAIGSPAGNRLSGEGLRTVHLGNGRTTAF
jgi:uncharacterized membrane protein